MPTRLALALLILLGAPSAFAQPAVPAALRADAIARGCTVLSDTIAYPDRRLPLFRFGVYETGQDTLRHASAAYWCFTPDSNHGTSLVIWRDWSAGSPVPGGCDSVIRYRGVPGGLRFERRAMVELREARLVDDPQVRGPRVTARGTVIVSEYGGVTARFICHTGRWYVTLGT